MKAVESRNGNGVYFTVNNYMPPNETPVLYTCKTPSGKPIIPANMQNTKQKTNDKFGVEEVGESAKTETQESGTSKLATSNGGSVSENQKMEILKFGTASQEGSEEAIDHNSFRSYSDFLQP